MISYSKQQSQVRNEQKSLRNHLLSICEDASIVTELTSFINQAFQIPLFVNKRNGTWYSHPNDIDGTSYFKSTDGHDGCFSFSHTRLNLDVAVSAAINKGIIITDSTRRGKRFPDSMRATIPIWCSVINKIVLDDIDIDRKVDRDFADYAPCWMSPSHIDQIDSIMPSLIETIPSSLVFLIRYLYLIYLFNLSNL